MSPFARALHDFQTRWGRFAHTVLVTAVSIAASLAMTVAILSFMDIDDRFYRMSLAVATVVPALVAPPISLAFAMVTDHLFELEHRLRHQATHDALTGVPNRHSVMQSLRDAITAPNRTDEGVGVLMIDVDHFKAINDAHGHETGDQVLRSVAQALSRSMRDTDRLGRYGGEEFLVLTPESTVEGLRATADRLRAALRGLPATGPGGRGAVTVSIGGALHFGAGDDGAVGMVLRRADRSLYCAKRAGRDRVEIDS